jgi:hypothetical protein
VYPGAKNPTHEISLSDGVQTWGLRLVGGPRGIEEKPFGPSILNLSNLNFGGDPSLSQIEQRDWTGGRGLESFGDDETGFFDSQNVWTTTRGRIFPTLKTNFAEGIVTGYQASANQMDWQSLLGETIYLSQKFKIGSNAFNVDRGYLWIRRKGAPAPLVFELYTDLNDLPNSPIVNSKSAVSVTQFPDVLGEWWGFDLSSVASLTASTKFHIKIYAENSDNAANHWEVGVDRSSKTATSSTDGTNWKTEAFTLIHRVLPIAIKRKWQFFHYQEGLYAYDQRRDGIASSLLINGDRGGVTAAGSSTLTDSNSGVSGTWAIDQWSNARIKITTGKGIGQTRKILSNTNTQLTLESEWDLIPNATSSYVIYASKIWQDISPTSGALIDGKIEHVLSANDQVFFSQGESISILKLRWDGGASPPAHQFADDSNAANRLLVAVDEINGVHIIRAHNNGVTISRASISAWGVNLVFGENLSVGDSRESIQELFEYHNQIFALKRDGLYAIHADHLVSKHLGKSALSQGLEKVDFVIPHMDGMLIHEGGNQVSTLSGAGSSPKIETYRPFGGIGLPGNLRGEISVVLSIQGGLLIAIDAGENGVSSLLFQNDETKTWHEVFRAWETGARIENIFWQACPEDQPRLWISINGEIMVQRWPTLSINPLEEENLNYHHEGVITSSTIDMGAVRFPKFIKQLSLLSKSLQTGNEISLDAQFDDEIGTPFWRYIGTFYSSAEDVLGINQGNVRKVRFRLRLQTNQANNPPIVHATILEGFVRTPLKYQWDLNIKVSDTQRDLSGIGEDHSPDAFLNWVKLSASQARRITVRSIWKQLDNKIIIVEPPSVYRQFSNNVLGFWGGHMQLSLREV